MSDTFLKNLLSFEEVRASASKLLIENRLFALEARVTALEPTPEPDTDNPTQGDGLGNFS